MDPNQQVQHTFENPITPHLRVNWLLVIIIVVGFFGVLTAGYFLGTRSQKSKAVEVVAEPTPTEYIVPTTAGEPPRAEARVVLPTPTPSEPWLSYSPPIHISSLKNFRLYYPTSWQLNPNTVKGMPDGVFSLELKKNNATINIGQIPAGGASCVYPGEPEVKGPSANYGDYKEFKKNNLQWRRAIPLEKRENNELEYHVCEFYNEGGYGNITSIGFFYIAFENNDISLLGDVDQIIDRIEIIQ